MIDWKLAPEGAMELRGLEDKETLKWFNKDGHFFGNSDWREPSFKWQVIATRPTQTKTVKDAVEHHKVWPSGDYKYLFFIDEVWTFSDKRLSQVSVCTREQFEAYVKEQEGEKWTHTHLGDKCKIVCSKEDSSGYVVVLCESYGYELTKIDDLKPIKPTISKAEAWDILKDLPAHEWSVHSRVMAIEEEHNIT